MMSRPSNGHIPHERDIPTTFPPTSPPFSSPPPHRPPSVVYYPESQQRQYADYVSQMPVEESEWDSVRIPRAKYWERRRTEETFVREDLGPDNGDIIDRISDEFRFLDDGQPGGMSDQKPAAIRSVPIQRSAPQRYVRSVGQYSAVVAAFVQILVAVGMLVFGGFRFFRIFNRSDSQSLLDFVKMEDAAASNSDGTEMIAIKLGASIFPAAIAQLLVGLTGLYPLKRRPPKSSYILHILFAALCLSLWIRPTVYAALEINLRGVQLTTGRQSDGADRTLLIILLCFGAVDVFVVNAGLLVAAARRLSSSIRTPNNVVDVHVGMLSVIVSAVCVSMAVFAAAATMGPVVEWPRSIQNINALYAFGLRETVVCGFVLGVSLFGSWVTVLRRKNSRLAAAILQSLCLWMIARELLVEDRLAAAAHNIRILFGNGVEKPIGAETVLLLYSFILLLTLILLIQLFSTTMNVFRAPLCDSYATAVPTDQRRVHYETQQRSAL